jgi:hypothetical protein
MVLTLLPALASYLNPRGRRVLWYFSDVPLSPGDKFGRYTIVGTLGIGGMGQVLRAVDSVLERTVALKLIRADLGMHPNVAARFFREARLAAQLSHPNTVQIYDVGAVDGIAFMAMELIDGKPMTQLCGDTTVDAKRKLRWMLAAGRGLAAAHRSGMVHRDVKPSNIMVVQGAVPSADVVKVVDFGLAKRTQTTPELRATFNTALGVVVGTPGYMAPEQLDGADANARSDQFSWAIVAYKLLTGANPRDSDPLLAAPIVPIARRVQGLPAEASHVLMKALELAPSSRFETMDQLVEALDAALNEPAARVLVTAAEDELVVPSLPFRVASHPLAPRRFDQRIGPEHAAMFAIDGRRSGGRGDGERHEEARALEDPKAWRFRRHTDACAIAPIHAAAIGPDGTSVIALGAAGIMTHENGVWRVFDSSRWLSPLSVRCVALLADGSAIVGGEKALAARILPNGDSERWTAGKPRDDITFHGVEVTPEGWITFVGSARGEEGAFGWVRPSGLEIAPSPAALAAVVTLRGGGSQLACGPNGAVVRSFHGAMSVRRYTTAGLVAVADTGDDVLVVGGGGHAFRVTRDLEPTLETVQTTASLTAIAITESGTAWAGTTRGRILRRGSRRSWLRVTGDYGGGVEPNILALWASDDAVRAVATDGSIIHVSRA